MNRILKYPGAKWGISSWIISFFPKHHSYLEPFFGSGGVFFRKPRSNIETVNDIDGEVINLFECVRENPERLAREILWTPYGRAIYEEAFSDNAPRDRYQRAMRLLIRCDMGHGFRTTGERVGWKNDVIGRERAYAARDWALLPENIIATAERLRGVQIECAPAVEVISRFNNPGVLIYCDPPYVLSTRHGKQYRNEMTDDDHGELIATLKKHNGPVLISGYRNPLYEAELSDWRMETTSATDQHSRRREEILWMNFEPAGQIAIF